MVTHYECEPCVVRGAQMCVCMHVRVHLHLRITDKDESIECNVS